MVRTTLFQRILGILIILFGFIYWNLPVQCGLYIEPRAATLVRRTFWLYATGKYSDTMIAEWFNQRLYIQKLRHGKKPIGKEMVRDLLQNKIYVGFVSYTETLYRGSLGQKRQSPRKRRIWFEGKHQGFVSPEVYEACQVVRSNLSSIRQAPSKTHTYLLHDPVYCVRCATSKPPEWSDKKLGKMRPSWDKKREYGIYRCMARDRGYSKCAQPLIKTEEVNRQVVNALVGLQIPDGFRERVETAVHKNIENEHSLKRIEQIEEIVKRIDLSWEQGFLSPEEYIEKRKQLQKEVQALRPVDYDDLLQATDLIENFLTYWNECNNSGSDYLTWSL